MTTRVRAAAFVSAAFAAFTGAAASGAAVAPPVPLPPLPEPIPTLLDGNPAPSSQSTSQSEPASASGARAATTTSVSAALARLVTVEMWLASPEHRRILLDKSWRQVGLGAIRAGGAGGVYGGQSVVIFAAEFGIRR